MRYGDGMDAWEWGTVVYGRDEALVSAMDRYHRGKVRVTGALGDRWQKDGK